MGRSRTGVHLVKYPATQDTPATTLAEAFALMMDHARDDLVWQDRALCAETDPESFFPEKGGSSRQAKRVCMACEVRLECLQYALDHDEQFGIWGGMSERARYRLKRGRDRAA